MKTFKKHLSIEQVKAACAAKNWECDTTMYEKRGMDWIVFQFVYGEENIQVMYSSPTGRFMIDADDGIITESDAYLEQDTPWYKALVEFLFYNEPEVREGQGIA